MGKGDYTFFITGSYAITFTLLMILVLRAAWMYRATKRQVERWEKQD
jgi:heme exporter protein CcmD